MGAVRVGAQATGAQAVDVHRGARREGGQAGCDAREGVGRGWRRGGTGRRDDAGGVGLPGRGRRRRLRGQAPVRRPPGVQRVNGRQPRGGRVSAFAHPFAARERDHDAGAQGCFEGVDATRAPAACRPRAGLDGARR